jgi:hypothetical protein
MIASFILGLGLISLFKEECKGADCKLVKAPPIEEITHSTYQLGSKCYQFRTQPIDCPKVGIIEPFQRFLG